VAWTSIRLRNPERRKTCFTDYLVDSIAAVSGLKTVSWKMEPSQGPMHVTLAPARFHDTLKCLLMDLADAGAKEITLSIKTAALGSQLQIGVDFGQPLFGFSESHLNPYRRRLRLMWLRLATRFLRTGMVLALSFS
jgi:hypothetical protein